VGDTAGTVAVAVAVAVADAVAVAVAVGVALGLGVGVAQPVVVEMTRSHPPAMVPRSCAASSTT
ncbi:MAG: hypothetical protein DMF06_06520, partial [Verrucomicrobia bacterium]